MKTEKRFHAVIKILFPSRLLGTDKPDAEFGCLYGIAPVCSGVEAAQYSSLLSLTQKKWAVKYSC